MPSSLVPHWVADNHHPYQTFPGEGERENMLWEDENQVLSRPCGLSRLCGILRRHSISFLDLHNSLTCRQSTVICVYFNWNFGI